MFAMHALAWMALKQGQSPPSTEPVSKATLRKSNTMQPRYDTVKLGIEDGFSSSQEPIYICVTSPHHRCSSGLPVLLCSPSVLPVIVCLSASTSASCPTGASGYVVLGSDSRCFLWCSCACVVSVSSIKGVAMKLVALA